MELHTGTTDTSPEALAVQLECLRRMSPHERLEKVFAWSAGLREMAFAAIRRRHPEFDEVEVRLQFIGLTYGRELADNVRRHQMSTSVEIER
ncbi:MAG: hypothetical protein O3B13_06275 [Planctomycetota bacterium]|nr:hypothetical protein [Planctomycetota bacterium]MDA1162687.1 hypothetical protein [Planctomycetota bacterium]